MNSDLKILTDEELLAITKAANVFDYDRVIDLARVEFWPDQEKFIATFSPAFVTSLIERAQAAEARARTAEEALKAAAPFALGTLDSIIHHSGDAAEVAEARRVEVLIRALSTTNTESDQ